MCGRLWNNPRLSSLTWSGGHLQMVELPDGILELLVFVERDPEDSTADLHPGQGRVGRRPKQALSVGLKQGQLRASMLTPPAQGRGHWSWDVRASRFNSRHPDVPALHPLDVDAEGQLTWADDTGWALPRHGLPVRHGGVGTRPNLPGPTPWQVDVASTPPNLRGVEGILVETPSLAQHGKFWACRRLDATFRNGAWQVAWSHQADVQLAPSFDRADHGAARRMRGRGALRQTRDGLVGR